MYNLSEFGLCLICRANWCSILQKKGKVKKASKKSGKSENSENLAVSLTDLSSYPQHISTFFLLFNFKWFNVQMKCEKTRLGNAKSQPTVTIRNYANRASAMLPSAINQSCCQSNTVHCTVQKCPNKTQVKKRFENKHGILPEIKKFVLRASLQLLIEFVYSSGITLSILHILYVPKD